MLKKINKHEVQSESSDRDAAVAVLRAASTPITEVFISPFGLVPWRRREKRR